MIAKVLVPILMVVVVAEAFDVLGYNINPFSSSQRTESNVEADGGNYYSNGNGIYRAQPVRSHRRRVSTQGRRIYSRSQRAGSSVGFSYPRADVAPQPACTDCNGNPIECDRPDPCGPNQPTQGPQQPSATTQPPESSKESSREGDDSKESNSPHTGCNNVIDGNKPCITDGAKGQKGAQGPAGNTGSTGRQGATGSDGATGSLGSVGLSGDQGLRGARGDQGDSFEGLTGKQGVPGALGPHGIAGEQGAPGSAGPFGDDGPRGWRGAQGNDGQQGPRGVDGSDADDGLPGPEGPQGPRGEQGTPGLKGRKGVDGAKGTKGFQGNPGPNGVKGCKGQKGFQGCTGVSIKGLQGDKGLEGEKGSKGNHGGDEGRGNNGTKGTKGEKGEKVTSCHPPGYQPEKGDMGEKGYKGYEGPKGFKGQKGEKAAIYKGQKGYPGQEGRRGIRGDQGPKGLQGDKGNKGAKGEIGEQGEKGMDKFIRGEKGQQGEKGRDGSDGPKGDKGYRGIGGEIGDKGQRGKEGNKGGKGTTGAADCNGVKGAKGDYPFIQGGQVYARHFLHSSVPMSAIQGGSHGCPPNHRYLWSGYSLLHTEDGGRVNVQDLGAAGSCIGKFAPTPFIKTYESEEAVGNYQPAQSYWLSAASDENAIPQSILRGESQIKPFISKCAVCMAQGPVLAFHSHSRQVPECPTEAGGNRWRQLWSGYSFIMHSVGRAAGGQMLESPGSCLPDYRAHPFIECNADQSCFFFSDKMSYWLMSSPSSAHQILPSSMVREQVGRCVVCADDSFLDLPDAEPGHTFAGPESRRWRY